MAGSLSSTLLSQIEIDDIYRQLYPLATGENSTVNMADQALLYFTLYYYDLFDPPETSTEFSSPACYEV